MIPSRHAFAATPITQPRRALALQEHEAILNALRRCDGVALSHPLRTHLRHKRDEVMEARFADTGDAALARH
jgi:DNA-binding GntR family transcriptional regulator